MNKWKCVYIWKKELWDIFYYIFENFDIFLFCKKEKEFPLILIFFKGRNKIRKKNLEMTQIVKIRSMKTWKWI